MKKIKSWTDEFKAFVDKCHENNLGIILDFAYSLPHQTAEINRVHIKVTKMPAEFDSTGKTKEVFEKCTL